MDPAVFAEAGFAVVVGAPAVSLLALVDGAAVALSHVDAVPVGHGADERGRGASSVRVSRAAFRRGVACSGITAGSGTSTLTYFLITSSLLTYLLTLASTEESTGLYPDVRADTGTQRASSTAPPLRRRGTD